MIGAGIVLALIAAAVMFGIESIMRAKARRQDSAPTTTDARDFSSDRAHQYHNDNRAGR